MKKFYITLFLVSLSIIVNAQKTAITGNVKDSKTNELLPGVTIIIDSKNGITTDINGTYILDVEAGKHLVEFKYIGYATETENFTIKSGEIKTINQSMTTSSSMLDEMVISAGKFEQKISDVTISIQTIKSSMIENNNITSIDKIISKVPSVTILNDQVSIRGGSGYSFGAGSRVLLLIDDLPMLSGSAGDIKWNFAPVENIEQIEVIKGASSALYGSSALNGIINIRTAFPGNKPHTKIIFNSGLYNNPIRKEIIWWGNKQPIFSGTQFSHSRKIGNFDLTFGGNIYSDEGYRENNAAERYRFNINTRYRDKKIVGLSYGINANMMKSKEGEFLIWQDGDSGVYIPSKSFIQQKDLSWLNIDPFIVYHNANGNRHSLKGRYFQINSKNNTNQNDRNYLYFGEYQYQKHFKNDLTFTSGLTGSYTYTVSDLFGNKRHFASSGGIFAQADKKFSLLTLSLGARYEVFKMDADYDNSDPVFRAGANYQIAEASFLRASFGQGFRYPTIAEKYTITSAGAIKIFPNNDLRPEQGWSSEIGFKQGFKISNWYGYLDVAGFWTQYHDMIEFTFGQHYPDSLKGKPHSFDQFFEYTGFKAFNISNAQINGFDITLTGKGKFFGLPATLLVGYTYTNPIDLDVNRDSLKSTNDNILKYRFYNSVKADFEVSYKKVTAGISIDYHSYMINIDKAFEDTIRWADGKPIIQYGKPMMFLLGLKEYRLKHNKGDIVFDFRISYQVVENSKISIVVKNLFNREYMLRPGDVQPPRNIAIQYALQF
ncbi:MAG: TonB-dependent receptor [Bacteroidetes bacterium]|nr:TonB-dependent receptor [Bacteroidota bacterium]